MFAHAFNIHPQAQGFVLDELANPNPLVNGRFVLFVSSGFEFENKHLVFLCASVISFRNAPIFVLKQYI